MARVFVAADDVRNDRAIVRGDDASHLATVLWAGPGMPLTVAGGSGTVYDARVACVGDAVTVSITGAQAVQTPTPEVHVAHALPKGRKLDGAILRTEFASFAGVVSAMTLVGRFGA